MLPELGVIALACGFVTALLLAGAGFSGARILARSAAQAQFVFVAVAFGVLAWSFAQGDFSIQYVAQHSNSKLPLEYRLAAVWGGHEGSLLLWTLILAGWTVAVALRSHRLPDELAARVLGAMGAIAAGFLAFALFASSPFQRLLPPALEGRDLNPLLQDPGMVFHPPLLYMGYVGFSVAFAFAVAALTAGRLEAGSGTEWARWARPWTVCAWVFLTLGIALGSFWAYYELGWGGWWFWDPVENASFMPWLVGTALVHSLAVTEKRGAFPAWTVLLAIAAFSLSLLGTFLVRSGVLTSVHAFATDPKRGIFILAFLSLVVGGSLVLFALRAQRLAGGAAFDPVSREAMLLGNNVLLLVAAASVALGTLYPLALDALGAGKISVGPPYFEAVFVPVVAPALFLMGVGPLAAWKRARLPELGGRLKWAAAASLAGALTLPFAAGWRPMVALGLFLALWIAASSLTAWLERRRARSMSPAYYGMLIAHLGVAVFIAGVTLVKAYESTEELRMQVGDTARLAGYDFRLASIEEVRGPNYVAARGLVEVSRGDAPLAKLHPEKRLYMAQTMPMTEAALDMGFLRHLYVALGEPLAEQEWVVRLQHKPFVGWIWLGTLLMAAGGALAAFRRAPA
ncbi:MAG: heme lyase CcmF/NrfE family subunit [Burkholderiales bacterium]